jgi:hypothetical protein
MAGKDDDIERLLAEMQALTSQADDVLGGDDATGKAVAPRRGSQPAQQPGSGAAPEQASREGLPPALVRALVVSGVATGLVWVALLVLPFVGLPLSSLIPVFLSSLLVAAFYTLRGRGR